MDFPLEEMARAWLGWLPSTPVYMSARGVLERAKDRVYLLATKRIEPESEADRRALSLLLKAENCFPHNADVLLSVLRSVRADGRLIRPSTMERLPWEWRVADCVRVGWASYDGHGGAWITEAGKAEVAISDGMGAK